MSGGLAQEAKKTTQWLFLTHIFSHVILQDHTALGASGTSSKANIWKRALLATVCGIALIWIIGMTVSYFENRSLEQQVRAAGEAIVPLKVQATGTASIDDLQKLDAARVQLERLSKYHRQGAPLVFHWGLYSADSLYADFRQLYFDRFKRVLFGDVQTQMGSFLRARPSSPVNPSDEDYGITYDTLKAYLMTTTEPQRSDSAFLPKFLMGKWVGPQDNDEQKRLAQQQFNYYADELRIDNPFPANDDSLARQAIDQGRRYLIAFTGANFVYRSYLAKLHKSCNCDPLDFTKKYPEASGVVREPKIVDAAFTKAGWKYMQSLISGNDWNTDDEWVLGPAASGKTGGVNTADVQKAYEANYIREWRDYVKSASVLGLGGPSDASKKLDRLTGNRSPLFELFCEVSENTAETSADIAKAFQPVTDVVKAPCYNLVAQDSVKSYVSALSDFKLCIDQYQDNPTNPVSQREDAYKSCRVKQLPVVTKEASNVVRTVDHEADLDKCVVSLLKLEACKGAPPPPPVVVVAAPPAAGFCAALATLSDKFPFRTDSNDDASMADFENLFRPGTGLLSQQLAVGTPKGISKTNLEKLKRTQAALYPIPGAGLQFHFTVMNATVPAGTKTAKLNLDGKPLILGENIPATQDFVWPGKEHTAELRFSDTALGPYAGDWAVFRLLGAYTWTERGGGISHLEGPPLKTGQGQLFKDLLDLKTGGIPLFSRGYLSQIRCGAK
jgi:type VI secretion system protein ImpL